jgi:tetratricopeptide (TPR) repeat protein
MENDYRILMILLLLFLPVLTLFSLDIFECVRNNDFEQVIEYIVMTESDPNVRDKNMRTPLHYASENNHLKIVIALLIIGADINTRDDIGNTPLHLAAKNNHFFTVHYLVTHNAKRKVKNTKSKTPLDYSIENNSKEVMRYLKCMTRYGVEYDWRLSGAVYLEEGYVLYYLNLYQPAINRLNQAIERDRSGDCLHGTGGLAYLIRGMAYHSDKQYKNAINNYLSAMRNGYNDKRIECYLTMAKNGKDLLCESIKNYPIMYDFGNGKNLFRCAPGPYYDDDFFLQTLKCKRLYPCGYKNHVNPYNR